MGKGCGGCGEGVWGLWGRGKEEGSLIDEEDSIVKFKVMLKTTTSARYLNKYAVQELF